MAQYLKSFHLSALFKISRPFTCISAGLTVLLGGFFVRGTFTANVTLAAFSAMSLAAAGNMFNDVVDLSADRTNHPERMLPSGQLQSKHVLVSATVLTVCSLSTASMVSWWTFVVCLLVALWLFLYTKYFKNTLLIGNLTIGILSGMVLVYGGLAVGAVNSLISLSVPIVLGITGRELLKTIADYPGDQQVGLQTAATVWGISKALAFYKVLVIAFIFSIMVPFAAQELGFKYIGVLLVGIGPITVVTFQQLWGIPSAEQLRFILRLQKVAFLIWLFAVVFDRMT